MKQNRKNIILEEINNEPSNPFNYYLLGLENIKEGNREEVTNIFEQLIINHSNYLPSYLTYSIFLIENNIKLKQAEELLLKGIEIAKLQSNNKAQSELQALLDIHF